jgi:uncharacterized protein YdeI (YjbR/CyaY-like superfamily)
MTTTPTEFPTLTFENVATLEQWMHENHQQANGAWIKIAKKASGITSVTHDEALDIALCFGWIDGQRKSLDESWFLQKFTPRRPRSLWSKRNIEKVTNLIAAGRMQESGIAEIELAKADGRWDAAYDSPKNMKVPEDFLEALKENDKASAFFDTLNKTNRFAIAWRLETARTPATRQRRLGVLIDMLERGEKFH